MKNEGANLRNYNWGNVTLGFVNSGFVNSGFVNSGFVDLGFVDLGIVNLVIWDLPARGTKSGFGIWNLGFGIWDFKQQPPPPYKENLPRHSKVFPRSPSKFL